jgi:superoxide dismutase, Cu-Zn family
MKRNLIVLVISSALAACATEMTARTADAAPREEANAALTAADGASRGSASLSTAPDGLTLHVSAEALAPGTHGIHVHTVGRCDPPDFQTAGAHWNPTDRQHGRDNPQGAHHGDLPNITIGSDGRGTLHATLPGATWASLFDADGAALVIHASADDYRTDPSGNSGGRIACGVITRP